MARRVSIDQSEFLQKLDQPTKRRTSVSDDELLEALRKGGGSGGVEKSYVDTQDERTLNSAMNYTDTEIGKIEYPQPDLSDYYKKEETNTLLDERETTEQHKEDIDALNKRIDDLDIPEIPDFNDYYTKEQIDEKVSGLNSSLIALQDEIKTLNDKQWEFVQEYNVNSSERWTLPNRDPSMWYRLYFQVDGVANSNPLIWSTLDIIPNLPNNQTMANEFYALDSRDDLLIFFVNNQLYCRTNGNGSRQVRIVRVYRRSE